MLIACALRVGPAQAQFFSPGPLAKPHAAIEGLDKCLRCHSETRALSAAGCLSCHNELGPSVRAGTGFHGRLTAGRRNACESCHPDHRGRDFPLVDWPGGRNRFDHAETGWRLEGAHARTGCDDCHRRALIAAPFVLELLRQTPRRTTYLGLSARCTSCHQDQHRGELGGDCLHCHTQSKWKPAPGFDHARTSFALRGKHAAVDCGKCHPSVADDDEPRATATVEPRSASFMQMKPIDHRTCGSCHLDPHEGKLGPACANCHSEAGWRALVVRGDVNPAFHENTRFPLRGGHIGVACRSCHGPFPGQRARYRNLPFSRCSDCHEDAHVGQLAAAGRGHAADCDRCHTVDGFSPPRFEIEQHASTAFPLEGAHAATACRGCHPLNDALAARVPAAVRRRLHAAKRPLVLSPVVMRPRERPQACGACHADPHAGQFADEVARNGCGGCHGTQSFAVLEFDHRRQSRFALVGAHVTVACQSCHRPERLQPNAPPTVRYKDLPITCAGCHADEHQGQFERLAARRASGASPQTAAGRPQTDCASCHLPSSFRESLFSHADARFTAFQLRGKHAALACDRCHRPIEVAPGVRTAWYRGVPTSCAGCHVDFHHGDFRGLEP